MSKDFIPYLNQTISAFLDQHNVNEVFVSEIMKDIEDEFDKKHAKAVKHEFDRRQKIIDDQIAEEKRLAAERKHRRERRRLLRLFCKKEVLLGT